MTDDPVALAEMLNMIRCKCKTDCSSVLCSCRKNGLKCVTACSNCCGKGCTNAEPVSNLEVNGDTDNELIECDNNSLDSDSEEICNLIYDSELNLISEQSAEITTEFLVDNDMIEIEPYEEIVQL